VKEVGCLNGRLLGVKCSNAQWFGGLNKVKVWNTAMNEKSATL
jgi:hypothetical protein